ncbi:GntR family transcriptional regulator (plasmid) [Mycobacterium sp. TJFP1]
MARTNDLLLTIQSEWKIDRTADEPIHAQIRDRLAELIRSGVLQAGDRIPSERTLATNLGVSRATARSALDGLAEQQAVYRGSGRAGTMVAARISHDLNSFSGFTESARRSGFDVTTLLLYLETVLAEGACAETFGFSDGELVHRVKRLRLISGEPSTIEDSFFPESLFPDLLAHDLRGSLYETFTVYYGAAPTKSIERVTAVAAQAEPARILEVAQGSPLLRVERVASHDDGSPCEFSVDLHRTDQVSFIVHGATGARTDNV